MKRYKITKVDIDCVLKGKVLVENTESKFFHCFNTEEEAKEYIEKMEKSLMTKEEIKALVKKFEKKLERLIANNVWLQNEKVLDNMIKKLVSLDD